jgi:hypothetical protein
MPTFVPDTVYVLALQGFLARPGYAAQAGELVKVTPEVANRAIAAGQARLPTNDDLNGRAAPEPVPARDQVNTRDPVPAHRDPQPSNRDPSMPRRRRR